MADDLKTVIGMVFENKNGRFRAFILPFIGMPVLALVVAATRILSKGITEKSMMIMLLIAGISLIAGACAGLHAAFKIPKMKITLSDEEVDVIKGTAKGTYLIGDLVDCRQQTVNSGRKTRIIFSLVFQGEDDILFIDCEGFSYYEFLNLADAVRIRKHALTGTDNEGNGELLSGDRFNGSYENEYTPPLNKSFFKFAIIMFLIIILADGILIYSSGFTVLTIMLTVFICIGVAGTFILYLMNLRGPDKNKDMTVKTLVLDSFDLKVNDLSWNYGGIEKIYITPPYLTAFYEEDTRNLKVFVNGSAKPVDFVVEKRPQKYDPSDEYTRLYNSLLKLCGQKGIAVGQLYVPENE